MAFIASETDFGRRYVYIFLATVVSLYPLVCNRIRYNEKLLAGHSLLGTHYSTAELLRLRFEHPQLKCNDWNQRRMGLQGFTKKIQDLSANRRDEWCWSLDTTNVTECTLYPDEKNTRDNDDSDNDRCDENGHPCMKHGLHTRDRKYLFFVLD